MGDGGRTRRRRGGEGRGGIGLKKGYCGVFGEHGKDRAKSIPKLIRELLMEVVPRGGPHRRTLIPRRLENPEEADYTSQRMHFCSAAVVPTSLLLRRVILD